MRRFVAFAVAQGLVASAACSDGASRGTARSSSSASTSTPVEAVDASPVDGSEAGAIDAASAASADGGPGEDAGTSVGFLRIAQFSTAVPAADFCVAAPAGSAFRGPLLGQLAIALGASPDAGLGVLAYERVSTYFTVDAGPLDVRLVPAGAAGCDEALGNDAGAGDGGLGAFESTALPALAGGAFVTILLLDGPSGGPVWGAITDDGALPSGAAALRAVNALTGSGPLDFGFGSFDAGWEPLFTNVLFGAASTVAALAEGTVDTNGYLPVAPFSDVELSARASADASADVASGLASAPFGSLVTVFAVAPASAGAAQAQLLSCMDNAPAVGVLTDCAPAEAQR
jgi:hypothetical protein